MMSLKSTYSVGLTLHFSWLDLDRRRELLSPANCLLQPSNMTSTVPTTNWYVTKSRSLAAEVAAASAGDAVSTHWPMHKSVPRPLVLCGPSGSGKSTLLKRLMEEFEDCFGFSVSHTTRKPRPGEVNGREYHFVSREDMENAVKNGEFIEFACFSGNLYGTSKKAVKDVQDQGRICILDVEIEGVKNLKKTDLNPRFIFVKPPNMEILEQRLRGRGTESEESIQQRLKRAKEDMTYGDRDDIFDLILVNENVEETYKMLRQFVLQDIEALKKTRGM